MLNKVYLSRGSFLQTVNLLREETDVEVASDDQVLSKEELLSKVCTVDAVLTQITEVMDRKTMETAKRLKVIANVAVGFDNIDVAVATELGIVVTNTPGILTETTADFAWMLMMATARRVTEANEFVKAGLFKVWDAKHFLGYDIHGKVLGIIGLGRIGQAVARRAIGFNMKVLACGRRPISDTLHQDVGVESVTLDELLRRSDFVSIHVPLSQDTKHLLNDDRFALMKPNCVLVNTSRGGVIEEQALLRALESRTIAAAGLDVFESEPVIDPRLFAMYNVVLSPHIAASSYETRLKMSLMAAENAISALKGIRPKHLVNPEVWERRRT